MRSTTRRRKLTWRKNVRQQTQMSDSRVWREIVPSVLGSGQAPLNKAASTGEALKWRLCCTKYKCSKVAFAMEEVAQALRRSRDASAVLSTRRRGTSQRRRGPRCCAGAGVQRWNLMSRVFSITHKRHRPQQNGSSKVGQRGLCRRSSRVLQEQGYEQMARREQNVSRRLQTWKLCFCTEEDRQVERRST